MRRFACIVLTSLCTLNAFGANPARRIVDPTCKNLFTKIKEGGDAEIRAAKACRTSCEAGEAWACARLGFLEQKRGNLDVGLKHLQYACEHEVSIGCWFAGNAAAELGNDDLSEALFKRGCDQTDQRSCQGYGIHLFQKGEKQKAQDLFDGACRANISESCHLLGDLLLEQEKPGPARAALTKACNLNLPEGCFHLGLFEDEWGSRTEAMLAYRKACDANHLPACVNAGVLEEDKTNYTQAKSYAEKACKGGIPKGCVNLENLNDMETYFQRSRRVIPIHMIKCFKGDAMACSILGNMEQSRGNADQAAVFFERACLNATPKMCQPYGNSLWVTGRHSEALAIWKSACEAGDAWSCQSHSHSGSWESGLEKGCDNPEKKHRERLCTALGNFRSRGGDLQGALPPLEKACQLGDQHGCEALGTLLWTLSRKGDAVAAWNKGCLGGSTPACKALTANGFADPSIDPPASKDQGTRPPR